MRLRLFLLLLILLSLSVICPNIKKCSKQSNTEESKIPNTSEYKVIKIIKRPKPVYTQGLYFDSTGKHLYESGGLYGESTLKKLKYPSLSVEYGVELNRKFFAEGIAQCGDTIYQLTWQEKTILKYDAEDLEELGQIPLDSKIKEGWGLAQLDSETLIATDGSANIYFLDCNENLKVKRILTVELNGNQLINLNELVFAKGFIYANVYFEKQIYKINPRTGNVVKRYDMNPLVEYEINNKTLTRAALGTGDVLNGIAYDKNRDVFLVTGKRWGYFYEVKLQ